MATGLTTGSSAPYLPAQTKLHMRSFNRRSAGSRVSDGTGRFPQKYGSSSAMPWTAAPPSRPSLPARIAMLCAMLPPALSPARSSRVRSARRDSQGSAPDPDRALLSTHRSAAHASS
uniref:Uncharacterized protein n=1 Tax=Triticum urartu TaxID=4572 RepID=A0A8R7PHP8_TRIUA